jgi:cbb3-type cytochrome oxidase subunit 1
MEWFIKAFIRSSLLWFATGIILGLGMAIHPPWRIYRPAHAHMNVAGFLTFLVFGVGYQLLPRLFGAPLYSRRLAIAHLFLANVGLIGLVLGFMILEAAAWLQAGGGSLYAAGALIWVWNLWRTFNIADARAKVRQGGGPRLPTLDQ